MLFVGFVYHSMFRPVRGIVAGNGLVSGNGVCVDVELFPVGLSDVLLVSQWPPLLPCLMSAPLLLPKVPIQRGVR